MTSGISSPPGQSAESNVVALPTRSREDRQQAVTAFIRDHPGLALAGGLLAGVVVSSLLPRKPVRKLAKHATVMSEIVGAAAMTLGRRAIEQAGATGSELRARGESLADRVAGSTEGLGEAAARRVGSFGHEAAERIGKLGEAAASRLGKAGITTDNIEKLGEAAVSRVGQVSGAAASRIGTVGEAAASRVGKVGEATASRVGRAGGAAIERAGELLAPAEAKVGDVVNRIARTASDLREKVRS